MRAKRTLAFMLSFMMLFSNSVTAFAQPTSTPSTEETVVDTSVFGEDVVVVENDDGTITITPDEDGDENDDELSTPDIVDEEQGDEDLNPDAPAVTAPPVTTTEETITEEVTTEEVTTEEVTTEEVTTEEGTTIEELLLGESEVGLFADGSGTGDVCLGVYVLEEGVNISKDFRYGTIADATAAIKTYKNAGHKYVEGENTYDIQSYHISILPTDYGNIQPYTVGKDDLNVGTDIGKPVDFSLNGYILQATASNININISINGNGQNGNGVIELQEGGSITLVNNLNNPEGSNCMPPSNLLYNLTIECSDDGSNTLYVGKESADVTDDYIRVAIDNVQIDGCLGNVFIYQSFEWGESVSLDSPITVSNMEFCSDYGKEMVEGQNYPNNYSESLIISTPLEVENLSVKCEPQVEDYGYSCYMGEVVFDDLTVTDTLTIANDTEIDLRGNTVVNDIVVASGNENVLAPQINIVKSYSGGLASLELQGTVTLNSDDKKIKVMFEDYSSGGYGNGVFVKDSVIMKLTSDAMTAFVNPEDVKSKFTFRNPIVIENGDGNYKNVIASDTYPFKLTKGSTTGPETLCDTIDEVMDNLTEPQTTYYLQLLVNEYTLEKDLLIKNSDGNVPQYGNFRIELSGNKLILGEDVKMIQTSSISGGSIELADNQTAVNFISANDYDYTDNISLSNIEFVFPEDATEYTVNINEGINPVNQRAYVDNIRWNCPDDMKFNLGLYGSVEVDERYARLYMYEQGEYVFNVEWDEEAGKYVDICDIEHYRLNVDTLTIQNVNDYYDATSKERIYQDARIGIPVTANNINVSGDVEFYSFNVEDTLNVSSDIGVRICTNSVSTINNMMVNISNNDNYYHNSCCLVKRQYVNEKDTPLATPMYRITGTVAGSKPVVYFDRDKYQYEEDGDWFHTRYVDDDSAWLFENGEKVAELVMNEAAANSQLENHYRVEAVYDSKGNRKNYALELDPIEEGNVYGLTVVEDSDDIRVYRSVSDNTISRGFTTLDAAKEYIERTQSEDANFHISLNKNCSLSAEESDYLDYTGINAKWISLGLDGHTLTFKDDAQIRIDAIDGGAFTVTDVLTVKGLCDFQSTIVKTKDLLFEPTVDENEAIIDNPQLNAENFTSTGTTTLNDYVRFVLYPKGNITLNNVVMGENASYQEVELQYEIDPTEEIINDSVSGNSVSDNDIPEMTGSVIKGIGNFTIKGAVSGTDENRIFFSKSKTYSIKDGEDIYYYSYWETVEDGEKLATLSNTKTTAQFFSVHGLDRCTKKVGTTLYADTVKLIVEARNDENYKEVRYTSLEDAVANLSKDFVNEEGNPIVGEYGFRFIRNDKLTKDVTIPSFVTSLYLVTDAVTDEFGEPYENKPVKWTLDLNGKKINTSASVYMNAGLHIKSSLATAGSIITSTDETTLAIWYPEELYEKDEEGYFYYDEDDNPIPMEDISELKLLDNVIVKGTNGCVDLYGTNGNYGILNASFESDFFEIYEGGNWGFDDGNITTSGMHVSGRAEVTEIGTITIKNGDLIVDIEKPENGEPITDEWMDEHAAYLSANAITLTSGFGHIVGSVEVSKVTLSNTGFCVAPTGWCSVGDMSLASNSGLDVVGTLEAKTITSHQSKIATVKEIGGTRGSIIVTNTLNVKSAFTGDVMGDYTVENHGQIAAKTLTMTAGTFANFTGMVEADSVTLKDYVSNQSHFICNTFKNTGKFEIGVDSCNLINISGTVNNLTLQDYGEEEFALLGRATDGTINITGTVTRANEHQRFIGFITDKYKNSIEIKSENTENYEWDAVELSIPKEDEGGNAIPDQWIDDFANVPKIDAGTTLFTTSIKTFPVEMIRVLPWQYKVGEEIHENENNVVRQEGTELKVTGEYIKIYVRSADGNSETLLKNFSAWSDASAYLNTLSSKTATYVVELVGDVDIAQQLMLPTNVGGLVIRTGEWIDTGLKDEDGYSIMEAIPVKLSFEGDFNLATKLSLEGVILSSSKGADMVINTKGNELEWFFSSVEHPVKQITGTNKTKLKFVDQSMLTVNTKISGLDSVFVERGSSITVNAGLSLNDMKIDEGCVYVKGSSSVFEVKHFMELVGNAVAKSDGTMKLNDVCSVKTFNKIIVGKENGLTITGNIWDDEEGVTVDLVYDESVNSYVDFESLPEEKKESFTGNKFTVKKNAISLLVPEMSVAKQTVLATAEKIPATWFVIRNECNDIIDITNKVGKTIVIGQGTPKNVVLERKDAGENNIFIDSYETLDDALTAIKNLNNEVDYVITLLDNSGEENYTAYGSESKDIVFPANANSIEVKADTNAVSETQFILWFKGAFTLNTDVIVDGITLCAASKTANYTLNNNILYLKDSFAIGEKVNFKGKGVTSTSTLIIEQSRGGYDVSGQITDIGTLHYNSQGSDLTVAGNIAVGDLVLYGPLTGLGTITVNNVEGGSTIRTVPKITLGGVKLGEDIDGDGKEDTVKTIKTIVPTLTIKGSVSDEGLMIDTVIKTASGGVESLYYNSAYENYDEMNVAYVVKNGGLKLATAANVVSSLVKWSGDDEVDIYKKSGALVYMGAGDYAKTEVTLKYVDEYGDDVETLCPTFADAVAEINGLKTKRDYTIDFKGATPREHNAAVTLPNKAYVSKLTLVDGVIQYTGNLALSCDTILDDVMFVRVEKVNGTFKAINESKADAEGKAYVSPITLNTSGNNLTISGEVVFNTPINMNGGNNSTLTFADADSILQAVAVENTEVLIRSADSSKYSHVTGSIKNFATINVDQGKAFYVSGYLTKNNQGVVTYNKTELSAKSVNISNNSYLQVGATGYDDKVTITDLSIENGAILSEGDMTITNATISGSHQGTSHGNEAHVAAYGQTFEIKGTLTNTARPAKITTGLDKTYNSALNISGTVILPNASDVIEVNVDINSCESRGTEANPIEVQEDLPLLGQATVTVGLLGKEKDYSVSSRLLKAKNADVSYFKASEACTGETEIGLEGYFLKKTKEEIFVNYGEEIHARLYKIDMNQPNNQTLWEHINYYLTLNDALSDIKALKDKRASYRVELLRDEGTFDNPVAVNIPAEANKIIITGENNLNEDIDSSVYLKGDIALNCDVTFDDVFFTMPDGKGGFTSRNISVKGYELELVNCHCSGGSFGKIDGGGKESKVVIQSEDAAYDTLTNIKNLVIVGDIWEIYKDVSVSKITFGTPGCVGASSLEAKGKIITADITSYGDSSISYYRASNGNPNLKITGQVNIIGNPEDRVKLIYNSALDGVGNVDCKYVLTNYAKLADITSETMEKFSFVERNGVDTNLAGKVAWASSAVYRMYNEYHNYVDVDVTATETVSDNEKKPVDKTGNIGTIRCFDMKQATAYINMLSDKYGEYTITIPTDGITDTVTSDTLVTSALTLPSKDKSYKVIIEGESEKPSLSFNGKVTTYGHVIFKDLILDGKALFDIEASKNSDVKSGKDIVHHGWANIDFENVVANNLKSISGTKGQSAIQISGSSLKLAGGIKNVLSLVLTTELETNDKSDVTELILDHKANPESYGAWKAFGVTTIGTINSSNQGYGSYIATYYPLDNKNAIVYNPQLTVTGGVTNAVCVQMYECKDTKAKTYKLCDDAADISDKKLLVAKTESADKFVSNTMAKDTFDNTKKAFEFKSPEVTNAYKDTSNYVYNGDFASKQVLLTKVNDASSSETYVATYADAIKIIDNIADKTADYTIALRKTDANKGIIFTTNDKNGVPACGKLSLPAANKAKSLKIVSETEKVQIQYTNGLTPKCDLIFENVELVEGKVDGGKFVPYYYITPDAGSVDITFGQNVETALPNENADDYVMNLAQNFGNDKNSGSYNLIFSKISGSKGSITLAGASHKAFVIGDVKVYGFNVSESAPAELTCSKVITFTDMNCQSNLMVNTLFTAKEWTKQASQMTVNGEVTVGEETVITVNPYKCIDANAKVKAYAELDSDDLDSLLIYVDEKPATFKKIISAPKMQTVDCLRLAGLTDPKAHATKYASGIYFTTEVASITVQGYAPDAEYPNYEAMFLSWEEAVKEIDKLNHPTWNYKIILGADIGENVPIKTMTLPAKAADVVVMAANDIEGDVYADIWMTGTTVTAKTPITFERVCIKAIKKTGNNYYSTPFTFNTGNYAATFIDMLSKDSQMKVSGSTKGVFTFIPVETVEDGNHISSVNHIQQISGVGTVHLLAGNCEEGYADTYYSVSNGISNVTHMNIADVTKPDNVIVDCGQKDINVKNLYLNGECETVEEELVTHPAAVFAKNVTVSADTVMATGYIKAGTTTQGDGKIALTNVIAKDNFNVIEGKQDKTGNSLINIKGTVTDDGCSLTDPAIAIGLYYNNSATNYAQLYEGMVLLTAPKASTSMFDPMYTEVDGMGYSIPKYGLYKSGNNIVYGNVEDSAEVVLHVGTSVPTPESGTRLFFQTFEEAVKAIDQMALFEMDATKKVNLDYTIELLKDVEIGNTKNDGRYSALLLPAKAANLTITSHEGADYSITYTGNITVKCNTTVDRVAFESVNLVKNEVVLVPSNLSVGNYELTWKNNITDEGAWKNVTGSSKSGRLIVENTKFAADAITGFYAIELIAGEGKTAVVEAAGNVTAKILIYDELIGAEGGVDESANLTSYGNLTLDAIYQGGIENAQIDTIAAKSFKLNGTKSLQLDADAVAEQYQTFDSVIFEEGNDSQIKLNTTAMNAGTKLITSNYIDTNDWIVYCIYGDDECEIYTDNKALYRAGVK